MFTEFSDVGHSDAFWQGGAMKDQLPSWVSVSHHALNHPSSTAEVLAAMPCCYFLRRFAAVSGVAIAVENGIAVQNSLHTASMPMNDAYGGFSWFLKFGNPQKMDGLLYYTWLIFDVFGGAPILRDHHLKNGS